MVAICGHGAIALTCPRDGRGATGGLDFVRPGFAKEWLLPHRFPVYHGRRAEALGAAPQLACRMNTFE